METKGYPQKQKNINVRKVKNVLGIDTETIMDLQNAMPFDIGYVVYNNKEDKIEKQGTYLVRKFVNNKYIILSSWSANKYERHYKPLLNTKTKDVKVESVEKIAKELKIGTTTVSTILNESLGKIKYNEISNKISSWNRFTETQETGIRKMEQGRKKYRLMRKSIYLGWFDTIEDAIKIKKDYIDSHTWENG